MTIGNPQAQQDYTSELARALADMQAAQQMGQQADALSSPQYAQNSGALGSLAMIAQAYAGKKLRSQSTADDADARERYYRGEAAMKDAEAQRKRNEADALAKQFNLSPEEQKHFTLTGKLPEVRRDRTSVVMTDQGAAVVNNDTGTYRIAQPEGAVQIAGDVPPEVRAAIQADPQAFESGGRISMQNGRALMPYKDPAVAQRQAAQDARADASLDLARRSADRADKAQAFAQEQALRKNGTGGNALEMWQEARAGLENALNETDTGYFAGRLPAITAAQQTAEGAVAATAPILKQIFRVAGEGTFTDKDQELLLRMVPTRTDEPEARKAKVENIDRIIRAKLGQAAPSSGEVSQPQQSNRIRIKL